MTLKEITKAIQTLVGTSPDGLWGKNTATAVLQKIDPEHSLLKSPSSAASSTEENVQLPNSSFIDLYPDDAIDERVHRICAEVISVFETGLKQGNYSAISIYRDGPGNARQITYGKFQTTESGNLAQLLKNYLAKAPETEAARMIENRLPKVGKKPYLVNDTDFIQSLKQAGREPEMQTAQDFFFDDVYWNPAYKWFHENEFSLPLSMLVIFDSFIHSGSILSTIRNKFSELPPAKGGDEKEWITQYVRARKNWLANHSRTILHGTVYRMNTMIDAMNKNNWNLDLPLNANGTIVN